ncbi:MAG: amino acid ABC transporter permease [Synergistales bacterium]|nr:amino acid ABC transporter permease [Synergistales bacterium]
MSELDWGVAIDYLDVLLYGVLLTLRLSAISTVVGLAIGIAVGLCRISKNQLIAIPAAVYVEVVRGIPLLVLLFYIYFGIGYFVNMPPFIAAVSGLGIFSGAFVAEIVRSGIESISRGQMEAARSTGMTYLQAMRYVILPQAFRRILPPLAGQFISLIKDSSLVSVISVVDLTLQARNVIIATFRSFEIWTVTALLYFSLTFTLSRAVRYLERRFKVVD